MSAESDKMRDTFADQLASYDDKLHATANNAEMLADIQAGIAALLAATDNSEGEIRKILQERYDQGGLRKETFQLVKSMLDRFTTENVTTFPVPEELASRVRTTQKPVAEKTVAKDGKDAFGTTTVIPTDQAVKQSADARVQVGSLLRDRFLLQEKIAGGSMGVVYKALDRRLAEVGTAEQWVAIKILSPQLAENGMALRALQQEAAKGRCLVHPNIVRFIDLDRDDDLYFLVMEWLDGRTLANILDSEDRSLIDRDAAFRITLQVGDALNYAHRCGIIHADVKPGNIMIMPNGDAKLFDFGVARVRQKHEESSFDPGVLGAVTPAYSSMQVLTGEEPVVSDDIFSLACLLYRLVAGYRVFGPRNAAEASLEGMTPQRPQSLTESEWRALKKALSYARVTRFDSVNEFLEALNDANNGLPGLDPTDDIDDAMGGGSGFKVAALLVLLGALGAAGYYFGYLDSLIARFESTGFGSGSQVVTNAPRTPTADTVDAVDAADVDDAETMEVEPIVIETPPPEATNDDVETEKAVIAEPYVDRMGPTSTLVDFSTLPAATIVVPISVRSKTAETVSIALREDGPPAIVDFVRDGDFSTPMTLRLEEVGFSGNRSPWAAGQFTYSNSGIVHFPAGQPRGRVTLTMASDPLREADQQSTLRLREIDFAKSGLAILTVALEDDDQREFESRLPVNTVAFAASQASIRESDPAVQIDVVRFNPDESTAVVGFTVRDITATEGEDYFAPGSHSITFGPRQRSARLLVPLVQDAEVEGDEAFVIELSSDEESSAIDVYQRIVVMIRDDEPQAR